MGVFLFLRSNSANYKINEIIETEQPVVTEALYESERGFGSDAYDIYEIQLNETDTISNAQPLDNTYLEKIKRFKDMLQVNIDNNDSVDVSREILNNLNELEINKNRQSPVYFYRENMDMMEYIMSVYNSEKNYGYVLYLKY
jgi:hypothetical protein